MKRKLLNLRFAKTTVFRTIMYLLITAVFLSLFSIPVFAEYKDLLVVQIENPMMTVNGVSKEIDPGRGTAPMIINNRTLLPIRSLIEEMGGTVGWDQGERRVDIKLGTIDIKLWIDDKTALVNDKKVGMDVPPQIINNRTMVPVRLVIENLGADVEWIQPTREVKISYNKVVPAKADDATGGTDKPGNIYATPRQPLFYIEDSFELLSGNVGKVTFVRDDRQILGPHTGFRLYFTNDDGNPDIYEFIEDGFSYSELIGKTVDISVTCVNNTAESSPFNMRFAMLGKVSGDTMWSERQTDDLMGAPCWYGLSWYPVAGATSYKVYVTKSISDYLKFVNNYDLSGFSSMITSDTYFSTKLSTGLPNDLVNASWAEERYVVIYPLNADGEMGLFPRHYKIPMTGISTKPAN